MAVSDLRLPAQLVNLSNSTKEVIRGPKEEGSPASVLKKPIVSRNIYIVQVGVGPKQFYRIPGYLGNLRTQKFRLEFKELKICKKYVKKKRKEMACVPNSRTIIVGFLLRDV